MSSNLTRRDFVAGVSVAAVVAALPAAVHAAEKPATTRWPIGCLGRPFRKWGDDATLDAIKAAGYQWAGLLGPNGGRGPVPSAEALAALRQKLAARGLKTNVGSLEVQHGAPLAAAIANAREQVSAAQTLGQQVVLSLGVEKEEHFVAYCKVMADAAAFGKERGVQVVLKPHHGLNNTAGELLGFVTQINHPNFKLWYDAGNVVYYTGKDPVAQLEIIAPHVTGVIAKDCSGAEFQERMAGAPAFGTKTPNSAGNEVMMQFGTGKVDFAAMFRKLKSAGFNGPIMVEGATVGATLEETTGNVRANREFLEKVIAAL